MIAKDRRGDSDGEETSGILGRKRQLGHCSAGSRFCVHQQRVRGLERVAHFRDAIPFAPSAFSLACFSQKVTDSVAGLSCLSPRPGMTYFSFRNGRKQFTVLPLPANLGSPVLRECPAVRARAPHPAPQVTSFRPWRAKFLHCTLVRPAGKPPDRDRESFVYLPALRLRGNSPGTRNRRWRGQAGLRCARAPESLGTPNRVTSRK